MTDQQGTMRLLHLVLSVCVCVCVCVIYNIQIEPFAIYPAVARQGIISEIHYDMTKRAEQFLLYPHTTTTTTTTHNY